MRHRSFPQGVLSMKRHLFVLACLASLVLSEATLAAPPGDFQAVQKYSQAFARNPEDWASLLFRGNAYARMGNWNAALRDYNYILERNPNYQDAYKRRGMLFEQMHQWDKAIDSYTSLIEMNPRSDQGFLLRGDVFARKGQLDQALDDYASAGYRNPRSGTPWYKRGQIYFQRQQLPQALGEYRKAILIQPTLVLAHEKVATCALAMNDLTLYLGALDEILKINPLRNDIRMSRAKAHILAGQTDAALADFDAALQQDAQLAEALFFRGEIQRLRQQCTEARQDLRKACRLGFGKACRPVKCKPAAPSAAAPAPAMATRPASSAVNLPPAERQPPPPAARVLNR